MLELAGIDIFYFYMFTKAQLDYWRSLGIPFSSFYDKVASDPKPSIEISFVSVSSDKDNFYIVLSIKSQLIGDGKAQIDLKEINRVFGDTPVAGSQISLNSSQLLNLRLSVRKTIISGLDGDYEWGGFEFKAYISCNGYTAETGEFKLANKPEEKKPKTACTLKGPIKVKAKTLGLDDKQKAEFISVSLGETNNGDKELWDVTWIYFNLITDQGYKTGMGRSAFYNSKPETYKIFMYYQGQGDEYKDVKMKNGVKIKDWVETAYFIDGMKKKINLIKKFIEDYIFIDEPLNPYPHWHGQGFWGDLNLIGSRDDPKWYLARTYFWLQEDCKVSVLLIKKFEDGKATTYIFDEDSIKKFFKEKPEFLTKNKNSVKLFTYVPNE